MPFDSSFIVIIPVFSWCCRNFDNWRILRKQHFPSKIVFLYRVICKQIVSKIMVIFIINVISPSFQMPLLPPLFDHKNLLKDAGPNIEIWHLDKGFYYMSSTFQGIYHIWRNNLLHTSQCILRHRYSRLCNKIWSTFWNTGMLQKIDWKIIWKTWWQKDVLQKEESLLPRKSTVPTTYEPRHEKTCLCHMRTTKAQISLRIHAVWSAPLLFAA